MKFTVPTKPFSTAIDLAVVPSNVTKFCGVSSLAQLTASGRNLSLNIVSDRLYTQVDFKGKPDDESKGATVMVDCLVLKQLVATFNTDTLDLEFSDDGLKLVSGKSSFSLPKLVDNISSLKAPNTNGVNLESGADINKEAWKSIKDDQLYTIAESHEFPVYQYVYVGASGDVIAGDIIKSLFTHTCSGELGRDCLLHVSIVNMINSLPEGAKLIANGDSYLVYLKTDGFTYVTEFKPGGTRDEVEEDYRSDIIMAQLTHPDEYAEIKTSDLSRSISQASLLLTDSSSTVKITLGAGKLRIEGSGIDVPIPAKCTGLDTVSQIDMVLKDIQPVINKYSSETICVGPVTGEDGDIVALLFFNDTLTTVLGGTE